jgi:hypothetical protein
MVKSWIAKDGEGTKVKKNDLKLLIALKELYEIIV